MSIISRPTATAVRQTTSVKISDIRPGDIVVNYGARLEVIGERRVYEKESGLPVIVWDAVILNPEEVEDTPSSLILSFARSDARKRGDDQLLTTVQSNDLARWAVETGQWMVVCLGSEGQQGCYQTVTDATESGALAAHALHARTSCPKRPHWQVATCDHVGPHTQDDAPVQCDRPAGHGGFHTNGSLRWAPEQ